MSDRTPADPIGDDDLAELRALGRRAGIDADHPLEPLEAPPPGIWDRIAGDLDEQPVATPLPLRRRPPRWVVPLSITAGIAVIAGVVVVGGDDPEEPAVVATATLDPLAGSGSGTAEEKLLDTDGHLQLRIETDDLDAGDGFLEVWVIDSGVERLVSLGPVRADGLYDLPTGLDPRDFPIVDVSVEPIDGNPTHSGNSLLRGQLEEVSPLRSLRSLGPSGAWWPPTAAWASPPGRLTGSGAHEPVRERSRGSARCTPASLLRASSRSSAWSTIGSG